MEERMSSPEPQRDDRAGEAWSQMIGLWIAGGTGIGTAIGVAIDNIGASVAIGIAVGTIAGGLNAVAQRRERDAIEDE